MIKSMREELKRIDGTFQKVLFCLMAPFAWVHGTITGIIKGCIVGSRLVRLYKTGNITGEEMFDAILKMGTDDE